MIYFGRDHHDFLEMPDGQQILRSHLEEGPNQNGAPASGRPQDGAEGPRPINLTLPLARNLLTFKETRITTLGGADV